MLIDIVHVLEEHNELEIVDLVAIWAQAEISISTSEFLQNLGREEIFALGRMGAQFVDPFEGRLPF